MKRKIHELLKKEKFFNVSVFRHLGDSKPAYVSLNLRDLDSLFSESNKSETKKSVELFNGTQFSGEDRQKDNAIGTSLLIFDLDAANYSYSEKDLQEIFNDCKFFAYETHSSKDCWGNLRWRVVIPLSKIVSSWEYEELWEKVANKKHLDADHATKSINAVFYLPEHNTDNENPTYTTNDKALLNPIDILSKTSKQRPLNNNHKKHQELGVNTDIRLSVNNDFGAGSVQVCGFSMPSNLIGKTKYSLEDLKEITSSPAVGLKLAELIGVDINKSGISPIKFKSRAIRSVLPWHSHDDSPSMGIMIKEKGDGAGRVIVKSFKSEDASHSIYDMHYIYACQCTGRKIDSERWTKSTSLVWLARALIDASVIKPERITVKKTGCDLPHGAKLLLSSMTKLAEARSVLDYYDDEEIVFSYSFSEIWSGISRQTTSKNFKLLVDAGVIKQIGVKTPKRVVNGFEFESVTMTQSEKGLVETHHRHFMEFVEESLGVDSVSLTDSQIFMSNSGRSAGLSTRDGKPYLYRPT